MAVHIVIAHSWCYRLVGLASRFGQSVLAESFQEAARERGLIESEDEHRRAMEEAQLYRMPSQFRIFFANLLLNAPAEIDAGPLCEEFAAGLAEDFAHQKNMPEDVAKDRALEHIQTILETKGKKNSHFKGLPDPKGFKEEVWLDAHVRAEMAFDWKEEQEKAIEMREKMYEAQAQAFDVITEAVRSGRPAIFFVDGPGGSGKSFLFEAIIRYVRGLRKLPLACAWSGIAASLLPNGRTVSSRFGLPVPLPEENARSYLKAQELKSNF